jgi:hypothetical protein
MHDKALSMEEVTALGDAIAATAVMIDVATHRFLTQLREFDRVGGWQRTGALSCAHWLAWRVGMRLGVAREKVRVARRLAELPLLDGALARGDVSYSKVRAMTRVATAADEADLLARAKVATGSQLERICRLKRTVNRLDAKAARENEESRRYVMQRGTDDGMVSTQVRLHPEEAARFLRALQLLGGGNLADGAVALADLALSGVSTDAFSAVPTVSAAGETSAARKSGATTGVPPAVADTGIVGDTVDEGSASACDTSLTAEGSGLERSPAMSSFRRRIRPPVEVVVHISAEHLKGMTELGDGIPAETCRRLLCDGGIVPMLEDDRGRTIDVGRKTRAIPAALNRALEARDGGCRFPGCTNRRFVDGHHIIHWIDGGETSLANTVLLCRRHHRYVHECGFRIEVEGEVLVFRDATGAVIHPQAERPEVSEDISAIIDVWRGDPMMAWREGPRRTEARLGDDSCQEARRPPH